MNCKTCGNPIGWEGIKGAINLCEPCWDRDAAAFDKRQRERANRKKAQAKR